MSPLEKAGAALAAIVALISIAKALWAVAGFFVELAANVRTLTDAVRTLTDKLDGHVGEMSDLRERVAVLEAWREEAA